MKINLEAGFKLIQDKQPSLTLFQFEKYWNWYLELNSPTHPLLSTSQIFEKWIYECEKGKPLGHILGQWAFYHDLFFVDDSTLIPRPETEIMVDFALKNIIRPMKVLEIGVGSGAVILSIMLHSKYALDCVATDISTNALKLCQKNYHAKKLKLSHHNFSTICTDRAQGLATNSFDLIICNPPYIPENHKGVSAQVDKFEPHLALYLPENVYDQWMNELVSQIYDLLRVKGIAIIEGHEEKLIQISHNINSKNFNFKILDDLNALPRFLVLSKN